jgi:hypothetical protein
MKRYSQIKEARQITKNGITLTRDESDPLWTTKEGDVIIYKPPFSKLEMGGMPWEIYYNGSPLKGDRPVENASTFDKAVGMIKYIRKTYK